jgi:tetratricopeptide (TPR) repeat protein
MSQEPDVAGLASGSDGEREVGEAEESEDSDNFDGAQIDGSTAVRAVEGPDVFISYRLEPDQATASALKRLVEGSIEPTPSVFVSGAGGLRPSSIGLKPQLQRAVTAARAFLAVITPQSKDREWVIFEAGAAWGRNQMYTPVLIETEPHELNTTIADFVAAKADQKDQMEQLIAEVAKTLGTSVRGHFSKRYAAFERHLEQRAKKPEPEKARGSDGSSALNVALRLWHKGQREDALEAFSKAESEAATTEAKAHVQVLRLNVLYDDEKDRFRTALLGLADEIRATAVWVTWKGITERRRHVAIEDYEQALQVPGARPDDIDFAVEYRARGLFELGRDEDAVALLMRFLRTVSGERRLRFVKVLWDSLSALSPVIKLMLAAAVTPFDDADIWRRLVDMAVAERWGGIGVHAGRRYRNTSDGGTAINSLGRIYMTAGLVSLAYEAFAEAVDAGVSVAKVNMAVCFKEQAVPGAGLALLRQHTGEWDAASPDFPFKVRGEIEEAVASERARADELAKQGRRLLAMLCELVDQGFARGPFDGAIPDLVGADGVAVTLTAMSPFDCVYEGRVGKALYGVFVKADDADVTFWGLKFEPTSKSDPQWVTIERARHPDVTAMEPPALAAVALEPPLLPPAS